MLACDYRQGEPSQALDRLPIVRGHAMLNVQDRVAMVSGASRGIGRCVVERLLEQGWRVSAGVRDPRGLQASDRLLVQRYDAESAESPKAWVAATLERFGTLHALVNAAGINTKATLADEDETALDSLWSVNVKAPLRLIRCAMPALRAGGEGRVVNVSSLSGKRVANENVGYAMSKFAVVALTHAVRREGWDDGVRATAVCPGYVATDMTMQAPYPREKMSDPRDVAHLIATVLALPNTAVVAELLINCRLEHML
jgi:NAD(P)-dependent dehydrogenase (short-subunit alcohol dehydrogenase family)